MLKEYGGMNNQIINNQYPYNYATATIRHKTKDKIQETPDVQSDDAQ